MQERKKKVAILTLGCRVNQSESSAIEGTLRKHGISIVALGQKPDICVVNTCTVTGKSDASSRNLIRRAARTGAQVLVTGCFSQLEYNEVFALKGVCEVVSNSNKEKIISRVLGYEVDTEYSLHDRARPYLKVQDGCNFSCTYCAVPMARGRSKSLPIDEAVARAANMASQGYQEIVLTGIHLGGYGRDLSPRTSLARLIRNILVSTSLFRIRLSSIEINEIDDELIELLEDPRVCRHLHLPLQSGSDQILKLMNRNYTAQSYQKKLLRLSKISSDMAFGTDVIVGFPAEGHKEFLSTRILINELPFSYVHTFPFSARRGTLAATIEPLIAYNIISDRAESLKELSRAKKKAFASAQANKILAVIAEGEDTYGHTSGTTSNYLKIDMGSIRLSRGSVVFVRSIAVNDDRLRGVMIS
jgi:threonylcarbamoyladenosine tRNA methylthiotransferase MtaB